MVLDPSSRMEDSSANVYLAPIMTTASTPATPGPSTPTTTRSLTLEALKVDEHESDIIPPIRPKSTPFPQPDMIEGNIQCTQRLSGFDRLEDMSLDDRETSLSGSADSSLMALPVEIHECILDHLFGFRASASSRNTAGKSKALRSWGTALRHSRRREVSELALVSKQWRMLIQDRLYRHLKIKGTRDSIDSAMVWFFQHPHLCIYVKHIEIWFPVFQQKSPAFERTLRIPSTIPDRSVLLRPMPQLVDHEDPLVLPTYQTPSNNCSLEEVFRFVQMTFAQACILTLEGGDRKKPPMVQHFLDAKNTKLPTIDTISTLVCKGQWNLIRSNDDFQDIAAALPNLTEWHGSYAKPKSKSYLSMAAILPNLSRNLTHLNICLEADYRREIQAPRFFKKVGMETHYCVEMARAIPTLEHLVYTGRVCHSFFDTAAKLSNARESRLKSIDLVVKNICRPNFLWNDGSGITDMAFILAFEKLVASGAAALDRLASLDFLRIRFIDLDSQVPSLNPYFQLSNNECTGLWSDLIVEKLAKTRPGAAFIEKAENLEDVGIKDGNVLAGPSFSKTKPLSIKVSSYVSLSSGININ